MTLIVGASRKQAGLYYDKGGGVLNLLHPDFGTTTGTGGDDTAALSDALAATVALGDGARLIIPPPPGGVRYNFNAQIAPSKAIIIDGGIAGPNNTGNHQGPTLRWTGGATPAILFTGTGCTNAQLRGISLDNSGTGTIGVKVETGRVKIRDFGIVAPSVAFSDCGIKVGLSTTTTPGVECDNVTLLQSGPVNLKLGRIAGFFLFKGGSCMDPSSGGTHSVEVGNASERSDYVRFLYSTFENTVTDVANIQVNNAAHLIIENGYGEVQGANGVFLDIPSGAAVAQGVYITQCRIAGISGSPYAVRSNFASALVSIESCLFNGTFTGVFNNQSVRHAYIGRNLYVGTGPVWVSSRKNVTLYQNEATGSTPVREDGYTIERIDTQVASTGNVTTGETDLQITNLPANRLYENGQTLEITAWGTTAANANTKQVKLYVAGTVVLDSTALAANNKDWFVKATVIRTLVNTAVVIAEGQFNGAAIQSKHTGLVPSSTGWDAAQIIKVTGTAPAGASNDILQKGMLVKASN